MPIVRIEPAGLDLEVRPGEAIAEAAWRQGYKWPTRCYGQAECMACALRVVEGELQTEPAGEEETERMQALLPRRLRGPSTRLACRVRVTGDGVVVEKKGVTK